MSALHFQKACCEGHNLKMKQYIFQQIDNSHSYNFVEKTGDLFMKLCKNEKKADVIDKEEADVAQMALDTLLEVSTGPCPRNQDFLSLCGFVETAQKVLSAPSKKESNKYTYTRPMIIHRLLQ